MRGRILEGRILNSNILTGLDRYINIQNDEIRHKNCVKKCTQIIHKKLYGCVIIISTINVQALVNCWLTTPFR